MSRTTNRLWILVAGFAALFLTSCITVGYEFPADAVEKITIGKTTREEVKRLFGPPWRVGIEDGKKTWSYGNYRYSLFSPSETTDLVIRFDEQNVVTSYTYNSTNPDR